MTVTSLAELNRRNCEFWHEQQALLESRMREPSLRDAALHMINSEFRRGVPVRSQLSLYEAFEEVRSMEVDSQIERALIGDSQIEQARKGRSSQKN